MQSAARRIPQGIIPRFCYARQRSTLAPSPRTLAAWKNADAVCFDVDSTVISEEGINVLAEHCGASKAVDEWTEKAMGGSVPFEEALAARLDLMKPSSYDFSRCVIDHPPQHQLTNGIEELIKALHARGTAVYLVSGGFRLMINPIADTLGIPRSNVFANTVLFDSKGNFAGFDSTEYTSRSGGKPDVIAMLKQQFGYETVVMVGDGATDMEASAKHGGSACAFIGFGGVVSRDAIQEAADWFVTDFKPMTLALE